MTLDPETGTQLPTSIRTSNKFYDINHTDVHGAIFPHHDLNTEEGYNHFMKCKGRFKKLKGYNVLFNYTYNKWENNINVDDMEEMVETLKNVYEFKDFRICFIGIDLGGGDYTQTIKAEYYDNWNLNIGRNSFTGGLFSKPNDNENYINIIRSYDISDKRITKGEIDRFNM